MPTPSGTGFSGPGKRLADASPGPWKAWRLRSRHAEGKLELDQVGRAEPLANVESVSVGG